MMKAYGSWKTMFDVLADIVERVDDASHEEVDFLDCDDVREVTSEMLSRFWEDEEIGPVVAYVRGHVQDVERRLAELSKPAQKMLLRMIDEIEQTMPTFKAMDEADRPYNPFGAEQDALLEDRHYKVDFRAPRSKQTRLEGLAKKTARNMCAQCTRDGLKCEIDHTHIIAMFRSQRMRCAVSGIPFRPDERVDGSYRNRFGISVDRIVNPLGYVPGNVRLTLTSVNIGINEWGVDHFRAVCHAVVKKDKEEMDEALMTGWRFSTRLFHVWEPPNFTDVGDDALIPLEDAVWLPELNQNFLPRELWQATARGSLISSRPTGKMIFVTRAWVREWIESSCPGPASQPVCISTKPTKSGASGTALTKSALASARTSTKLLKAASKRT